ncbi:biopolymer transporter ExbD [candidate division KSB1 bacterium]|nr:biopolymer transporter ExbD [candidate division KSB1 bacterium]
MQFHEPKKKKVVINITSLIDVLFLLLIFFMVSSTFREQPGMNLDLPESHTHEIAEIKDAVLQIIKDPENNQIRYLLNTKEITYDSLSANLAELLERSVDKALTLKADKKIEHGLVVKVMDIARQRGVKKLVVATKVADD